MTNRALIICILVLSVPFFALVYQSYGNEDAMEKQQEENAVKYGYYRP